MPFTEMTMTEHRGVTFAVTEPDGNYRITVPGDMLDDECGADADNARRIAWVEVNLAGVLSAYGARTEGGYVKSPYNRVMVEDLD